MKENLFKDFYNRGFLEDKKNEYLDIIQSLKIKKRYANLNSIKLQERLEKEKQKNEIENIDFNF